MASQTSEACNNTTAATTTVQLCPPEQLGLRCPRCDSPNTKFCYYNNYSLTQPRYFCKTCRRYWTKGGALRNVPVGGGCRKNKRSKSSASSSSSSSSSSRHHVDAFNPMIGISLASATDFIVGFNYPLSSLTYGEYSEMGCSSAAVNSSTHSSLASSIESLSSINQDLHWKLQQQRLAMLYEGGAYGESSVPPLPFHVAENSIRADVSETDTTAACFIESSDTVPNTTANNKSSSNWSGIPTWNDMHQFTALPLGERR